MDLSRNIVNNNKPVTSDNDLHTDLLKNCIRGLEKQLPEKNAIINYLTMQLIQKFQDKTICSYSNNNNHQKQDY